MEGELLKGSRRKDHDAVPGREELGAHPVVGEDEAEACSQCWPGVEVGRAPSCQVGDGLRRSGRSLFYSHSDCVRSHLYLVNKKHLKQQCCK